MGSGLSQGGGLQGQLLTQGTYLIQGGTMDGEGTPLSHTTRASPATVSLIFPFFLSNSLSSLVFKLKYKVCLLIEWTFLYPILLSFFYPMQIAIHFNPAALLKGAHHYPCNWISSE